ncbi:unnamed protein product [Adineta steineri]|uniref:Uncharacterized protein n=1 Tax=Adineta steineri TaxID=433720 RepID=A0A819SR89_9BILA|nr:unnamed protein product [Adineta steineri]CAF4066896.1 unnamed protein product [Adineta steineri]
MPRSCCRCSSICCLSRRKSKSFPIHEKQREAEVNKIFIRHVGSVRVTTTNITDQETKSKGTIKNNSTQSSLKSKQVKTPPPSSITINDIQEENHDKTATHTTLSIDSGSNQHKKNSKHQSCNESYDLSKENKKKPSNDIKSSAKSKVILDNVRKMIQDQQCNSTRQRESARL